MENSVGLKEYFQRQLDDFKAFVEARFIAQNTAILKSEASQAVLDAKNNEFRQQLARQEDTYARKPEVKGEFDSIKDQLSDIKKDISSLRDYRSESSGRQTVVHEDRQQSNWTIGIWVLVALELLRLIAPFFKAIP